MFALLFCAERNYDHCRHINGHSVIITCNIGVIMLLIKVLMSVTTPSRADTDQLINQLLSRAIALETSVQLFTSGLGLNFN